MRVPRSASSGVAHAHFHECLPATWQRFAWRAVVVEKMATILGCANRVRTHDGTVGAMVSPAFSRPSPALFANGRSVTRSPIGWTSRCSNQPTPVSLSRSQHGTVGLGTRAASGADGSSVETTTDTKKTTADTTDTPPPGATNVRVRVLRGELEIPRICSLCAAVFKEVAVPMPEGTEDPLLLRIGDFLESRYETAMVKDLSSVITKNMREKQRSKNQWHQEFGRIKARATARELQALQRTRTSVDSLTIEQVRDGVSQIRHTLFLPPLVKCTTRAVCSIASTCDVCSTVCVYTVLLVTLPVTFTGVLATVINLYVKTCGV